ncbi:MAG: hypothetical protein M1814_000813 [Vezdaea aestivalis]|nr:MAG: hypothetical protein M1814_000813 [Vezdaea aestivalis]
MSFTESQEGSRLNKSPRPATPTSADNSTSVNSTEAKVASSEQSKGPLTWTTSLLRRFTTDRSQRDENEKGEGSAEDGNVPPPLITETITSREEGYPQLAQFLSSADNVLICRKFGWLHSRLLLYKQDELAQLERDLHALDKKDAEGDECWRLYSRFHDESRPQHPRKALIADIEKKLVAYDELVDRIERASHRKPPSDRNFTSLFNWIWNEKPVINQEFEFVFRKDDLVAIKEDADETWLDDSVANFLNAIPGPIVKVTILLQSLLFPLQSTVAHNTKRIFASKADRSKPGSDEYGILSPTRVDHFTRVLIALLAMLMMTIPIILLSVIRLSISQQLGIVFSWIAVLAIAVALLTPARRFEVVAVTAA